MSKELKDRKEIAEKYKWDLTVIYSSDADFESELNEALAAVKNIADLKAEFTASAQNLLTALEKIIQIEKKVARLYTYAHLKYDQNTALDKYQGYRNKALMCYNQLSSQTSFMVPALIKLGSEKLKKYCQTEEKLKFYDHFFANILRQKAHFLSEGEEKILALAGEVTQGAENIFSMLNNADLEFPLLKTENGDEKRLTHGRYIDFLKSPERRLRKDAFKAMHTEYEKLANTFASVLDTNVKSDVFYARARNYPDSLTASLDNDNITPDVYQNLINTVSANLEPLQEYIALKKQALNLDELHVYDIYTPLIKETDLKFKYEETKEIIKAALKPLGKDYVKIVNDSFSAGWIDVYENKGKRSGAYSSGCYGVHPYILLNYTEDISNIFTLVHEMGHAMHSYYANQTQPYLYADYKIFVAEVASTTNENLLLSYLLENAATREEKLYLLNYFLEGFRATVYRQTMFAEFEKIIHSEVEKGESLTAERMKQLYRKLNRKYFGEQLIIDQKLDYEWARIPHFYYNFYVYKYATGYSAATALAEKILQEGETAAANYREFLKAGGSDYPLNLMAKAGVDMEKPAVIENAIAKFADYLAQFKELL
ncbi:oligoendopeptidase F [Halanaerobium salsuginis]|uniref:Oligopeptidase F n=1 Tax=Halanaerobium salsuginis TaxID=29563 RepID=A0A1I4F876_9FIRM|nr:oligoendopeptidase F [Halanaerobium salsuginis]SFL13729.1 oligopeptidase F. Metallo peptidase. MEROPS family M03B [Halanaerobium salsuginis]